MKILAIDPGPVNMGVCVWENGVFQTSLHNLYKSRTDMSFDALFGLVDAWCRDHEDLFVTSDVVLIEQQFPSPMKLSPFLIVIMVVCQTWARGKYKLIRPMDVKRTFGISCTGKHASNKRKVEEVAARELPQLVAIMSGSQIHDQCDAALLVKYFLKLSKTKDDENSSYIVP